VSIKWDAFKDMGSKLKSWRHGLKGFLKIQSDDTPATVRARVEEQMLFRYNCTDLNILLDRWCSEENQVGHKLYLFLGTFIKTNALGSNIKNVNCVEVCCAYKAIAVIEPNTSLHQVKELCQGDT
jgi:hypothetical protein